MTTVNCVRWSPTGVAAAHHKATHMSVILVYTTGKVLASAGDRGAVLLWSEPDNAAEPRPQFGDDPDDKPTKWRIKHNYKCVVAGDAVTQSFMCWPQGAHGRCAGY